MLVKQEIIIMGAELELLLNRIETKAISCGYDAREHFNDGFHCLLIETESHDSFSVDHEKGAKQLRVWPGPPCDQEETMTWNKMLSKFFTTVIEPVCSGMAVAHLSEEEKNIDEFFSEDLVKLLNLVVAAGAGTSTRWRTWASFLVKSYLASGSKYSSELYQWLEDEGVDQKSLARMINDFELSSWILDEYFNQFPEQKPIKGHPESD